MCYANEIRKACYSRTIFCCGARMAFVILFSLLSTFNKRDGLLIASHLCFFFLHNFDPL